MQHPNTPATSERSYPLDFLKILATIIIVFHHFQQTTGITYEGTVNFYYGKFYFGYVVELFFVLSGFFMLRYIKKIQNGLSFQEFYLKRAFRLLPLVACSAIVYEVLLEVYHFLYRTSWFDVEVTLFGVLTTSLGIQSGWAFSNPSVNNPVWYISVLLLCYAVFYLLTRFHGKTPCCLSLSGNDFPRLRHLHIRNQPSVSERLFCTRLLQLFHRRFTGFGFRSLESHRKTCLPLSVQYCSDCRTDYREIRLCGARSCFSLNICFISLNHRDLPNRFCKKAVLPPLLGPLGKNFLRCVHLA